MLKEFDKLVEEYHERIREKYDISFDKLRDICIAPFMYFKKMMESPLFPVIKIKYFGKLVVYSGTIKRLIGNMSRSPYAEMYTEKIEQLKTHLHDKEHQENTDRGEAID